MKPAIPLHDPRFAYINAAKHSDSSAFRARQDKRIREAQANPNNVKQIQRRKA